VAEGVGPRPLMALPEGLYLCGPFGGRAAQSFTEADQHIAAAVVKRMRVEKRSAFDLEPPIEGHRSFPKRFGGHRASRLAGLLQCNTVRHGFTEYSARSGSVVVQQGSAPCRV
jgi:hypothetical protein